MECFETQSFMSMQVKHNKKYGDNNNLGMFSVLKTKSYTAMSQTGNSFHVTMPKDTTEHL